MKKFLLLSVVLILCIGILNFVLDKNYNDGKEVIKFASWGSQSEIEILKPILSDFENQYPEYKIEFMHIPDNYFQKIHLLFASNLSPDVIFMNNLYLPFFANAGMLEELNGSFTNYFEPKSLQALSYKGKLYAVPRDISTIVVYINEDIFEQYGENLPKKNWDFDDFLDIAETLTQDNDNNGKTDMWGVGFEEKPILFYLSFLMSEGGGVLSDDLSKNIFYSAESQKGLNFYADLRNRHKVAPTKSEIASVTMAQMFLQGKLSMQISGRWLVPKYISDAKFNWNIINLPRGEKGSIAPIDASGWCISGKSKNKAGAKKLIAFLSNRENIAKFTQSGLIVPARTDVLHDEFLNFENPNSKSKLNNKAFLNAIKTGKPTPVSINYNEVQDEITSQTNYLFNK